MDVAKKIADKKAFYINQFSNRANVDSHFKMLGPEIYKQLNGKVDASLKELVPEEQLQIGRFLKVRTVFFELVLADLGDLS